MNFYNSQFNNTSIQVKKINKAYFILIIFCFFVALIFMANLPVLYFMTWKTYFHNIF